MADIGDLVEKAISSTHDSVDDVEEQQLVPVNLYGELELENSQYTIRSSEDKPLTTETFRDMIMNSDLQWSEGTPKTKNVKQDNGSNISVTSTTHRFSIDGVCHYIKVLCNVYARKVRSNKIELYCKASESSDAMNLFIISKVVEKHADKHLKGIDERELRSFCWTSTTNATITKVVRDDNGLPDIQVIHPAKGSAALSNKESIRPSINSIIITVTFFPQDKNRNGDTSMISNLYEQVYDTEGKPVDSERPVSSDILHNYRGDIHVVGRIDTVLESRIGNTRRINIAFIATKIIIPVLEGKYSYAQMEEEKIERLLSNMSINEETVRKCLSMLRVTQTFNITKDELDNIAKELERRKAGTSKPNIVRKNM